MGGVDEYEIRTFLPLGLLKTPTDYGRDVISMGVVMQVQVSRLRTDQIFDTAISPNRWSYLERSLIPQRTLTPIKTTR